MTDTADRLGITETPGVLLLSGGMDSAALAAWLRPSLCLTLDYGQRPAKAEHRASQAICNALTLAHQHLRMDLTAVGGGLLAHDTPLPNSPSPEWWPFRNQFLVTAAAAVAIREELPVVYVGTVDGDGARHADGTAGFYEALDRTLSLQEGGVHVSVPAIGLSTIALIRESGIGSDVLGWTISCHRSNIPCGRCPGCWKRARVVAELARPSGSQ